MDIGRTIKMFREHKKLSQGDIEKRTGLLRCYVSRVENGHTVPAIETIEKMARALDTPMYQLFIGAQESPTFGKAEGNGPARRKSGRQISRFASLLAQMKKRDRELLLTLGSAMAARAK